jgi:hypothetical protein
LQQYYNLPAQEQDFNMQDAQETEQDLTQKAADFGRGARPAAPQQPQAPVGVQ